MITSLYFFSVLLLINVYSETAAADNHLFSEQILSLQEALELTRNKQPNIQFQQQAIHFAKGEAQQEAGEFDPRISGSIERGRQKHGLFTDESSMEFEVNLNKRFRSGQEVRLAGVLEHKKEGHETFDSFVSKEALEDDESDEIEGDEDDEDDRLLNNRDRSVSESRASVYLEVIQPLLRNRGIDASGADEKAAQMIVTAQEMALRDKVAKSLLDTTLAYWDYVAAKKILNVRKEVANRFRQDVNNIRTMQQDRLHKDDHEASEDDENDEIDEEEEDEDEDEDGDEDGDEDEEDINNNDAIEEAEAELFSRDTTLTQAEQIFFASKQALGLAIGLTAYPEIRDLPEPEHQFARLNTAERDKILGFIPLYQQKMRLQRDAVLVLEQFQQSSQVLVYAAKRNLLPRFDLVARVGYSGNDRGRRSVKSFKAFGSHTRGLNWIVGGQFSYPIGNNVAEGKLRQEQAILADLQIQQLDLIRTIDSDIATLAEELFNSSIEIDLTKNTIKLFKKALDRLKKDFKKDPDSGKLIDLISVENDWIDARLEKIEQQQRHASAIASLSYETGDVLEPGSDYRIKENSLTGIPFSSLSGNN